MGEGRLGGALNKTHTVTDSRCMEETGAFSDQLTQRKNTEEEGTYKPESDIKPNHRIRDRIKNAKV